MRGWGWYGMGACMGGVYVDVDVIGIDRLVGRFGRGGSEV